MAGKKYLLAAAIGVLGVGASFFANGRWLVPLAAFLAPLLWVRFLRLQKPLGGFLWVLGATWLTNFFIWKGMIPVSGFFYVVLMLMMGLFHTLPLLLDRLVASKIEGFWGTLLLPSAFVLMEFVVVSTNPSGSYGTLAHTQSCLPLLQVLSLTGIWGLTFLIIWPASALNWLWDHRSEQRRCLRAGMVFAGTMLLVLLFGAYRLSGGMEEKTVRIAAINLGKTDWENHYNLADRATREGVNASFLRSCDAAAASGARVVFGSELLLQLKAGDEAAFISQAQETARRNVLYLGLPLLVVPSGSGNEPPYNKILWISPAGELLFEYHKAKPTPGEGQYGDGVIRFFDSPFGRIGSAICFDMDFPSLIRQTDAMHLDLMLVPGLDWREITPYHTYVASFRAIEHGFSLVRSASQGLSAAFDPQGRLRSSSDFFATDEVIFYADVPMRGQRTLYALWGDAFAWLCMLILLLGTIVFVRRSWRSRSRSR